MPVFNVFVLKQIAPGANYKANISNSWTGIRYNGYIHNGRLPNVETTAESKHER